MSTNVSESEYDEMICNLLINSNNNYDEAESIVNNHSDTKELIINYLKQHSGLISRSLSYMFPSYDNKIKELLDLYFSTTEENSAKRIAYIYEAFQDFNPLLSTDDGTFDLDTFLNHHSTKSHVYLLIFSRYVDHK